MFNSENQQSNALAIAVTLTTGETVKGALPSGITGKLADAINKPDPFIELTTLDGKTILIAKTTVARIEPIDVPRVDQLSKRLAQNGALDPYSVLGVNRTSSKLDVQSAYHNLARRYHPDHFSGREIPPEVLQYVSAMFKRITAAYNDLKGVIERDSAA